MRPGKEAKRRNRNATSPTRTRPDSPSGSTHRRRLSPTPAAGSVIDRELVTEELSLFENLQISSEFEAPNPRSFPYSVKQQCWDKADKVKGRDPDRWRRDALGNIVFRKLVGCPGCLCHDYDHIIPYSKARVNRSKGNRTEVSKAELIQKSSYCRVSGRDMDLLELTSYGNVKRGQDSGGCNIQ
ncbi:PREDICTED: uncharacterized protein LOC109149140 isoform X2 [Ipomoea nil]|uniref:uncharacterized protein LOC109149140 isoform X2 n=1 Tax=Ipomoea nil TaxID=35883 RepID=UPI000901DAF7|nr:PREDICTED: uncharacterized protein LOC109149140 isoform X2 [Ipomoea nil]